MGSLRGWELLIILLLVVILFGAKKLPEAARGIGRSLRIFKAETKTLSEDNTDESHQAAQIETAQIEAARPAPMAAQAEPVAQPAQPVQPPVSGTERRDS